MIGVYIVILVTLLIVQILKICNDRRYIVSPGFIFLIVWSLIFILYSLGLYDINSVSESTLLILFLGVICTVGGITLGEHCTISKKIKSQKILSEKAYYICSIILFGVLIATAYNSISLILSGATLGAIRYSERAAVLNTGMLDILYNYYAVPMGYLLVHVNLNEMFNQTGKKKIYMGSTILIAVASILTEAGRFIIYFIAIDAIVLYLWYNRQVFSINPKIKRYIRILISASVIGFIFITVNRGSDILKTVYTYVCGCVPYFENKIQHFDTYYNNTYFFTSLNGLIRPFFVVINKVIGIKIPEIVANVEAILLDVEVNHQLIAPTVVYNGFVSMFFSFYADLGVLGIAIYSFAFGGVLGGAFRKLLHTNTNRAIVMYMIMIQAISISMMRFFFVSFNFALMLVYINILFSKKNHMFEEESLYKSKEKLR